MNWPLELFHYVSSYVFSVGLWHHSTTCMLLYCIFLYLVFTLSLQPLDAFKEVTKITGDILGLGR